MPQQQIGFSAELGFSHTWEWHNLCRFRACNGAKAVAEDPTHLLHGMVHMNGFGHLIRVNGREGGSRFLSGCDIMGFWDRLCKMLRVRWMDVLFSGWSWSWLVLILILNLWALFLNSSMFIFFVMLICNSDYISICVNHQLINICRDWWHYLITWIL